jgi:hypothetical protein
MSFTLFFRLTQGFDLRKSAVIQRGMLSSRLGFPTVNRWAPLGGRGFSGAKIWGRFGDYTETITTEGSCGGADFRCSARPEDNGIFSCRPCTTSVLNVFKDLQGQMNRLVVAKGLSRSLLLDIDGRIGPQTIATARAIAALTGTQSSIPPGTEAGARWLATRAEAAAKELKYAADQAGAPTKPPVPPAPPVSTTPIPPGTTVPGLPVVASKSKAGLVVGGLAALTAVGLVAAAYYRKR